MLLYHGTSAVRGLEIMASALKPSGRIVYLTDCHAPYYAWKTAIEDGNALGMIIEIDTEKLDKRLFCFDEYALEPLGRGVDSISGSTEERLVQYRRHVLDGTFENCDWNESLAIMGSVGYKGVIPRSAITRYAMEDAYVLQPQVFGICDPTIDPGTHPIHKSRNRTLTRTVLEKSSSDENWTDSDSM